MANTKTTLFPEFPTEWHQERHLEDLERELAGRERRIAELNELQTHPDVLAQAEADRDAVLAQLERYGKGPGAAAKRPRTATSTRAKKK